MKVIYLIRHAQTEYNLNPPNGDENIVTKDGLKQIKYLAKAAPKVDILYSSDKHRALLTAEAIAKVQKKKIMVKPEFQEIYGCLVGGVTKNPESKWLVEGPKRSDKAFKFIKKTKKDKIAIVCHGNFIKYILAKVANLPLDKMNSFIIQNCSITTLIIKDDGKMQILSVNNTRHLPSNLRNK